MTRDLADAAARDAANDELASRLEENYRSKIRVGMSHEAAERDTIAESTAGPAAIEEFKRRIANPPRRDLQRQTRERAKSIRGARLNPRSDFKIVYIVATPRRGGAREIAGPYHVTHREAKRIAADRFPSSSYFKPRITTKEPRRETVPAAPGPFSKYLGRNPEGPTLYDAIRHGSRVTIVDRFGKQRTGRAVMRGPAGWVLNMGGPHGTPGIAHPDNVTRVKNPNLGYFQEEIKSGSRVAIVSANTPEGPYTIRLYVNDGETATTNVKKATTLGGARGMAKEMVGGERQDPRERRAAPRDNPGGIGNHKPGCKCAFCERARDVRKMVGKMPAPVRGVVDRNPSPAKAVKLFRKMEELLAQGKLKASNRLRMRLAQINKKMGWSMADVAERSRGSNPGAGSAKQRRRPGPNSLRPRRNPSEVKQAVSLFQTFHGRDPKEIAEKHESAAMRLEYAALGDLDYLIVQPPDGRRVHINFEGDGVKLASAPSGRQLYLIGGNQNLSSLLEKFTDDPEKDFIDLGEALEVQYEARKIHSNFAPTQWYHKFGEKNGALPRLMYDKLKKRIFVIGGEYFIDTADAVSPGIEN